MRIRSVKPEFFTDDQLGAMPIVTRLAYIHLWCIADDKGRFRAGRGYLRTQLLPYDAGDREEWIRPLVASGHLVLWEQGGERYGHIPSFSRHQHPQRPTKSQLPEPPQSIHGVLRESSASTHGMLMESSVSPHHSGSELPGGLMEDSCTERRGEERRVDGEEGRGSASAPPPASATLKGKDAIEALEEDPAFRVAELLPPEAPMVRRVRDAIQYRHAEIGEEAVACHMEYAAVMRSLETPLQPMSQRHCLETWTALALVFYDRGDLHGAHQWARDLWEWAAIVEYGKQLRWRNGRDPFPDPKAMLGAPDRVEASVVELTQRMSEKPLKVVA